MPIAALTACGDGTRAIDADPPSKVLALDCGGSQPLRTDLDVPGPGQPTPELAVEPYAEGAELIAESATDGAAIIYAIRDGRVVRKFSASEQGDGWWPDSYLECARP